MKFGQLLFIGDPNPHTYCIGGCDLFVLENLNINLSSVKRTQHPMNNQQNGQNNVSQIRPTRQVNNTIAQDNHLRPNTTLGTVTTNILDYTARHNQSNRTRVGDDDNIVCKCNTEALQLTVRKDGPNKGRKFYKCEKSTCDFFLWAEENDNNSRSNTISNNIDASEVMCNCNTPAVQRTVSKEGPNKGRSFYCCSKPIGQGCRFFQWADEVCKSFYHHLV